MSIDVSATGIRRLFKMDGDEVIEGEADKGRGGQALGAGLGSVVGGLAGLPLGPGGAIAGSALGGAAGSRVAGGRGTRGGLGGLGGPLTAAAGGAFDKPATSKNAEDAEKADERKEIAEEILEDEILEKPCASKLKMTDITRHRPDVAKAIMWLVAKGVDEEMAHKVAFVAKGRNFVSCPTCYTIKRDYDDAFGSFDVLRKAFLTGAFSYARVGQYDRHLLRKERDDVLALAAEVLKAEPIEIYGDVEGDVPEEEPPLEEEMPLEDDEVIEDEEDKVGPLAAGALGAMGGFVGSKFAAIHTPGREASTQTQEGS